MRIQILGTAAAEGWPGIFCGCNTCARARAAGGKNLRSRASLQIDDIFKIDLPPDTYYHSIRFGIDLSKLKYLFYTHSHGDHFAPDEIEYLRQGFAYNLQNAPVRIYGNEKVIRVIKSRTERRALPVKLTIAEPYVPIHADHLTFTPIVAKHSDTEQCLNYIIQSDSATVLYASDTGFYDDETLGHITQYNFDLLIVECTFGPSLIAATRKHMNVRGVLKLKDTLVRAGAAKSDTPVVLTHFSHSIGLLHDELERIAERKGMVAAYDGMVLEV